MLSKQELLVTVFKNIYDPSIFKKIDKEKIITYIENYKIHNPLKNYLVEHRGSEWCVDDIHNFNHECSIFINTSYYNESSDDSRFRYYSYILSSDLFLQSNNYDYIDECSTKICDLINDMSTIVDHIYNKSLSISEINSFCQNYRILK